MKNIEETFVILLEEEYCDELLKFLSNFLKIFGFSQTFNGFDWESKKDAKTILTTLLNC